MLVCIKTTAATTTTAAAAAAVFRSMRVSVVQTIAARLLATSSITTYNLCLCHTLRNGLEKCIQTRNTMRVCESVRVYVCVRASFQAHKNVNTFTTHMYSIDARAH